LGISIANVAAKNKTHFGEYIMIIKTSSLPENVLNIVLNKSTEYPFSGEYHDSDQPGTYLCRLCGLALFRSKTKFHSGCGWPSFDEEIKNAVTYQTDADGRRVEILCSRCNAHLGHAFQGEGFTDKNLRHCVNSASLDFVANLTVTETEEAIFAAGCFWGVEYYFKQLPGVLKTEVGYSGGAKSQPTYDDICAGNTGHYEVIRVIYDPSKIDFTAIAKYFFEIHDPTQTTGQGPDLGEQYLSVAFYYTDEQKHTLIYLIDLLQKKGLTVATNILPVHIFWRAELYHQDYYSKTGKNPYCHHYEQRF
jgi:peptide methionine sulfoxide reductase msrA/msrB